MTYVLSDRFWHRHTHHSVLTLGLQDGGHNERQTFNGLIFLTYLVMPLKHAMNIALMKTDNHAVSLALFRQHFFKFLFRKCRDAKFYSLFKFAARILAH